MMDPDGLLAGVQVAFTPTNLILGFVGVLIGVIVGALPGLGPATAIAVLVPLTFSMDPATGLIMLIGVFSGAVYGGSISAVLLNIPGTSAAIVTCWDGNPLARQGRAQEALRISVVGSYVGGTLSALALLFLSPFIATLAIRFAPPEYVALAVFGLAIIASLEAKSLLRGLIAALIGLTVSLIGQDPVTGFTRYTFGELSLFSGVSLVPVLIGLFVLPELVELAKSGGAGSSLKIALERFRFSLRDLRELGGDMIRGSAVGVLIGALPGAGGTIATFVSYNMARNRSKTPELFGKGSRNGLAATEASNNGGAASSLIPLITLGIPGSAAAAVFLGSLTIHGLRPGPQLFTSRPEIVYGFLVGSVVVQVFMLLIGLYLVPYIARVTMVPRGILIPGVLLFASTGAYALGSNMNDVRTMFIAGLVGVGLQRVGLSRAALILGLILGPIIENNLYRTRAIYGDLSPLYTRPVPLLFYTLAVLLLLWPTIRARRERSRHATNQASLADGDPR